MGYVYSTGCTMPFYGGDASPHGCMCLPQDDAAGNSAEEPPENWIITLKLIKKNLPNECWKKVKGYMGNVAFFLNDKATRYYLQEYLTL